MMSDLPPQTEPSPPDAAVAPPDPLLGSVRLVRPRSAIHATPHVVEIMRRLEDPDCWAVPAFDRYIREHRQLGSSDRAIIGDLVFALARWRRRLDSAFNTSAAVAVPSHRMAFLIAGLLSLAGYAPETVQAAVARIDDATIDSELIERVVRAITGLDPVHARSTPELAVTGSLPSWIAARLSSQYGLKRARNIVVASRRRAPVTIRVNSIAASREEVASRLAEDGVLAEPTTLSPWGLVLPDRNDVRNHELMRSGTIEVQDEGSQLIVLLAGVRPGMRIVDACAGAGGKTLGLAADMNGDGEILALDTDADRLDELSKRSRRAGIDIIRTAKATSGWALREWESTADIVLIDAPCSGSGTWRRVPDGPEHLTPDGLRRYAEVQTALLDRYAWLVRPGGTLVYATCSILREEGEEVVEPWLVGRDDFSLLPIHECDVPDTVARQVSRGPYLATAPDIHRADGFFAARMVRHTGTTE